MARFSRVKFECAGDGRGTLIIKFEDGESVILKPGEEYEAWIGPDDKFWKHEPTWLHRHWTWWKAAGAELRKRREERGNG